MHAENSIKDRFAMPTGVLHYPTLALCWLARNMVGNRGMLAGLSIARAFSKFRNVQFGRDRFPLCRC